MVIMSIKYGAASFRVTQSMIDGVTITGGTIISQGDTGHNNSYEILFQHDLAGCGNPASGIVILLKDTSPNWKYITWEWRGTGTASCWTFNHTAAWALSGTTAYNLGYLQAYDESLGDRIFNSYLSWEIPEYQTHNRVVACNNNADNFFRFNSSQFKSFFMQRRRDNSGNLAGIHHSRSCSSTGSGSRTNIRNIYVYL
jgi:hypothetical protein